MLCKMGFLARSLADLSQALRLDPENPNVHFATADCLLSGDNPEPARRLARQGAELGSPGGVGVIAIAELMLGNRPGAIEVIENMIEAQIAPERSEFLRQVVRSLDPDALSEKKQAHPHPSQLPPWDWGLLLWVGRYEDYMDGLAMRGSLPWGAGAWSNRHTAMRRDPRFITAMEKAGAFELWRELGPPPDCRVEGDEFTCGYGHEPVEFTP